MSDTLAQRMAVLRDEVLDTASLGDEEPPGSELFDAILRELDEEGGDGDSDRLASGLARRLAWGAREVELLADIEVVCRRLLDAAERSFRDPADASRVATAGAAVACRAARLLSQAAVGRAERERAAHMREELAQGRLRKALERQRSEIGRLESESGRG